MKYLKYFNLTSDYEAYKNGSEFILPNVSFVEEIKGVKFSPKVEKWGKVTVVPKWSTEFSSANDDNLVIKKIKIDNEIIDMTPEHVTYAITDTIDGLGYYGEDGEYLLMFKITAETDILDNYEICWYRDGNLYSSKKIEDCNKNGCTLIDNRTFMGYNTNVRGLNAYDFGRGFMLTPVLMDGDKNIIPCIVDLYILPEGYNNGVTLEHSKEVVIEYVFDEEMYNCIIKSQQCNYDHLELYFGSGITVAEHTPIYNETINV